MFSSENHVHTWMAFSAIIVRMLSTVAFRHIALDLIADLRVG
jgi:hypothetical protein